MARDGISQCYTHQFEARRREFLSIRGLRLHNRDQNCRLEVIWNLQELLKCLQTSDRFTSQRMLTMFRSSSELSSGDGPAFIEFTCCATGCGGFLQQNTRREHSTRTSKAETLRFSKRSASKTVRSISQNAIGGKERTTTVVPARDLLVIATSMQLVALQ